MPPYIEADSHQDNDWELKATSSQTKQQTPLLTHDTNNTTNTNRDRLDSNDSVPSPLFRDSNSLRTPTSGGLDRRMSDPDGLTVETTVNDDPLAVTAPPAVVSRITAIIGPESAYVKKPTTPGSSTGTTNSTSSSSSAATKATTPKTTTAVKNKAQPSKKPSSQTPNQQSQPKPKTKPLHIQVQHCIRKKGWRVAITKSLPRKIASSMTISPANGNTTGGAMNTKASSVAMDRNVI